MSDPTISCLECRKGIEPWTASVGVPKGGALCQTCAGRTLTVYKIELNGPGNALFVDTVDAARDEVASLVSEGVPGDSVTVTVEAMGAPEFHNLGEHGGW